MRSLTLSGGANLLAGPRAPFIQNQSVHLKSLVTHAFPTEWGPVCPDCDLCARRVRDFGAKADRVNTILNRQ